MILALLQVAVMSGVSIQGGISVAPTQQQSLVFITPISSLNSNNTASCIANGSPAGCAGAFSGLTDHCSQSAPSSCDGSTQNYSAPGPPTTLAATNTQTNPTVQAPQNVNLGDMHSLLYSGSTTKIVCWMQRWFGNNQHISIAKNDSVSAMTTTEINEMLLRGCDYIGFDFYGQSAFPTQAALNARDYLDTCRLTLLGQCMKLFLQEDHNSLTRQGGLMGTLNTYETDLLYAFSNFMNHSSYWKVTDSNGCGSRPVFAAFGWGGTLSTNDWGTIKSFIKSPTGLNVICTGEPVLIDEGENGLAFGSNRDGAYNWIGVGNYNNSSSGTVTTQGLVGTGQFDTGLTNSSGSSFIVDHFYSTAQADVNFDIVQIGSVYAGFNDTNANWGFQSPHTQGRKNARQCGQVWMNAWKRPGVAGYGVNNQLKYIGIVTLDDYEEGTAIEPGIDGCWNITMSLGGGNLTINLNATDVTFANLTTVQRIELWASIDGIYGAVLATLPALTSQIVSLTSLPGLIPGSTYRLYARKVGFPGINNTFTGPVTFAR